MEYNTVKEDIVSVEHPQITIPINRTVMFFENNLFKKIIDDVHDAVSKTIDIIVKYKESAIHEDQEFCNEIILKCTEKDYFDGLTYDQLFAMAKLLLGLEKKGMITLRKLMEFCYELFLVPVNISYAVVDLLLYAVKERIHQHMDICSKFTECVYFSELTPLLTLYIEFGSVGEEAAIDITAYDPMPNIYQTPESIKLNAEKALTYGPSAAELEEFSKIDIGKIVIHINDCFMTNQLQIVDSSKPEELPNDIKNDIRYILNSTTMTNIQQKSQELANRVQIHHYGSLSQFLITAISSMSINVDVVSNIWLRLDLQYFYPTFVSDFCNMIKKIFLLGCDRLESVQNFFVYGNIFGEITLNRNVPICDRNIDLKYLLIEAFFKRTTLHHVLVFVSRTLIKAKQSQFFRTYNYFILQILSLLKEIYVKLISEGKTQIPFEIEQTFKDLGLDIKFIRPSTYLDYPAYIMTLPLIFHWTEIQALQLLHHHVYLTGFNHAVTPCAYQCLKYRDIEHIDISRMLSFFNISFNAQFPKALSAKVAIHYAIEKTYNEYAKSVSERVNRGCLSLCETLILKDFPQDQFDDMMRRSVIDMARSIACSYSYTTLHGGLYSNLYKSFRQNINEILLSTTVSSTSTSSPSTHNNSNSTTHNVAECSDNLAADNIDLLINIIQKYCGEKLLTELVKRISISLESRSSCSSVEKSMRLASYNDSQRRLPPRLRVSLGAMSNEHKLSYTKFINYQPGFMPDISTMDHLLESAVVINSEKREQLELICLNIEQLIDALKPSGMNALVDDNLIRELSTLKEMIKYLIESRFGRVIVAIVKHLIMTNFYVFGNCLNSQVAIPLRVIVYFREILDVFRYWDGIGPYRLAKFVTRVVIEVPQALQFSNETVFHLVRNFLIIVPDYDIFLAKCIDNAKNGSALRFAMLFCKTFLVNEKQYNITNDHLKLTLSTLQYLTTVKNDTTAINLEEHLKAPLNFSPKAMDPSSILPGIDFHSLPNQLANMQESDNELWYENLFVTWLAHYYDDPIIHLDPNYISAVRKAFELGGYSPKVDYWKDFVRCTLKYGFKECLREDLETRYICRICDSMTGFCSLLIKSLYEFSNIGNISAITQLFIEIGTIVTFVVDTCADAIKISVISRFLSNLCLELRRPFINDEGEVASLDQEHDPSTSESKPPLLLAAANQQDHTVVQIETPTISQPSGKSDKKQKLLKKLSNLSITCSTTNSLLQLMHLFANLLHSIRPTKFPKFAAHWQKVVISTNMIPTLIAGGTNRSGWLACNRILIDMLLFLGAIIRQCVLAPHRVKYFEEALNFFNTLKEDFPVVISNNFMVYIELIPMNAIQLRNIFLSASPIPVHVMPNPFKHRLEKISDYEYSRPKVVIDSLACFENKSFRDEVLKYFIDGMDDKILEKIYDLVKSPMSSGSDNSALINTIVLNSIIFLCGYFGSQIKGTSSTGNTRITINIESVKRSVPFYIIMYLLSSFDSKNQYIIVNSMANHLRYPNAYTRFFKCAFIAIARCLCQHDTNGDEEPDDTVLQLIVRTLTERLLPRPPHPWGVIATLSELLIDPSINLLSHNFIAESKDMMNLLTGIREKAVD